MKRITVIAGHYGSGKSTFAANYAIDMSKKGEAVTVVDMDTVNPYYRTADLGDLFAENGVKELVIVAQDVTAYGIDLYKKYALPGL